MATDTFETAMATMGLLPDTVVTDPRGTIMPSWSRPESQDDHALQALPPLSLAASEDEQRAELCLGEKLGEGGMGVVRLARQLPLARDVAVKSVRPDKTGPEATLALLREAWVTGSLEHPNVVPIHALGCDAEGAAMFVMKRIHGVSWRRLLREPESLPPEARADPLGWHLEVLLQVCNAVAFAHSRGVVHRDLKPDNVMVGPFGEVYVLDWGLAVSTDPENTRLPRAADVRGIAGTPQYMSPEMVAGDGGRIGLRSDVYLLGAVLHQVITGRTRHGGVTPWEVLAAAWRSPPYSYGPDVPEELAAICNRATAPDPEDRFGSALELKAALAAFVKHRHSLAVAQAARGHLSELRGLLASAGEDVIAVGRAFSACRFGFQLALDAWPGNTGAREGLREALRSMVEHELRARNLRSALSLVAELREAAPETADDALDGRIAELEASLAAERAHAVELERLRLNADLRVGSRTRAFFALALGVLYGVGPLVTGGMERRGTFVLTHGHNIALAGGLVALVVAGLLWARETMFKTEFNQRVSLSLLVVAALSLIISVSCWQVGVEPRAVVTVQILAFCMYMGMLGATLDRRLFLPAAAYLLAFAATLLWTRYLFDLMGAAHLSAGLAVAWFWRPERLVGRYAGDARGL